MFGARLRRSAFGVGFNSTWNVARESRKTTSLQLREIEKQQAAASATMIKFMVFECSQVDTLS